MQTQYRSPVLRARNVMAKKAMKAAAAPVFKKEMKAMKAKKA